MTATSQNLIQEEIKRRLNSDNAGYHSVRNVVFSSAVKKIKIRLHRTIILPVVLYGCETWSLTLREEHRMRVFENSMLRRIFGSKKEKVMRRWRKLHEEELHDLYSSSSVIRKIESMRMIWVGHTVRMGNKNQLVKATGMKDRRKVTTKKTKI
jgi:hypothetical protein